MTFETVRIEGSIFTEDILEKVAEGEAKGQSRADFKLSAGVKVKDETASAWVRASAQWQAFLRTREYLKDADFSLKDTMTFWVQPLLNILGYDPRPVTGGDIVEGRRYDISYRDANLHDLPVMVIAYGADLDRRESKNTDSRSEIDDQTVKMSAHGRVQEYLNLTEHLYAIVTNGRVLRLLRDSSRLVKLSFLEFDLQTMMEDGHFSDFALLYRLLHASRMPVRMEAGPDSLIESYHQDSLESGSRIRQGLSQAVEHALLKLAQGFLHHPDNGELRQRIDQETISGREFYTWLLHLIYRLLFLLVIEERGLIYPADAEPQQRDIYYNYYSIRRLRLRCQTRAYLQDRHHDLWLGLNHTFVLFQSPSRGKKLGIQPLGGDLFNEKALGRLDSCLLENHVLLTAIRALSLFDNPATGQTQRVNYGSLNVEEFGSVYEGLLEYEPKFAKIGGQWEFTFHKGQERSTSGSHYTPDELVQPLIKHSLDHVIRGKLASGGGEEALLSIRVCDVACGSGHILLNAARRIGMAVARLRTDSDQPDPESLSRGIGDAINHCIHGVDKNPLAVELCKVALWLEAHQPGKPLTFLDHRIKCGDAIVGLAHAEELKAPIPDQAFKALDGDHKGIASEFRKRNKKERETMQKMLPFEPVIHESMEEIVALQKGIKAMPQETLEQVNDMRTEYMRAASHGYMVKMKALADMKTAQFFTPKTEEDQAAIVTTGEFRRYLGAMSMKGEQPRYPYYNEAAKGRYFHWFLEFPEVFANGGFDCILGNPPYLGGQAISGNYGDNYLNWLTVTYKPASGCDIVTYFVRRTYDLIKNYGFSALITTNSISEGRMREGALDVILNNNGTLNFAVKSVKWPGKANLYVSLISIIKGSYAGPKYLDNKQVDFISSFFDDVGMIGEPYKLPNNKKKMFQGSIFLGDGFVLKEWEKNTIIEANLKNSDVIFPLINGSDINNKFDQQSNRFIINFFDWEEGKASEYDEPFQIIKEKVKPVRDKVKRKSNRERWWIYAENRPGLYKSLSKLKKCFLVARTTKYLSFSKFPTNYVFTDALFVYATERFFDFSLVQSTIHEAWARKYSSTLETRLRYAPSDCFETFPFPQGVPGEMETELEKLGETYHEFRRKLMLDLKLGLTKTYNQFHNPGLQATENKPADKESAALWHHLEKTPETIRFDEAVRRIRQLRDLHTHMDQAVLNAYGWQDITLEHGFHEVDYLPENDRMRYTISAKARKEILKRLLQLNHNIHEQENKTEKNNNKTKIETPEEKKDHQRKLF